MLISSRWYLCTWKTPCMLHPISQRSLSVVFVTVPAFISLMLALSCPFNEDIKHFLFPCLPPPENRCHVPGCVLSCHLSCLFFGSTEPTSMRLRKNMVLFTGLNWDLNALFKFSPHRCNLIIQPCHFNSSKSM